MIVLGTIIKLADNDEEDYPTNTYEVEITIDRRREIIATPISIMGNANTKSGGFLPTFSDNEQVLVFLIDENRGVILGAVDVGGSFPLADETVLLEKGGAKIHLGDGHGFDTPASGVGSLTMLAQRLAVGVGNVENFAHDVNEEFYSSDYQDKESYPYEPTFPEEGFYVETEHGDSIHMASGTILIKSGQGDTEIRIDNDGTININSNGNVIFQGGSNTVLADNDNINLENGVLVGGTFNMAITGGMITMSPIGAPIAVAAPSNLIGSQQTIIDADINAGTVNLLDKSRKEKVE